MTEAISTLRHGRMKEKRPEAQNAPGSLPASLPRLRPLSNAGLSMSAHVQMHLLFRRRRSDERQHVINGRHAMVTLIARVIP